MVRIRGVVERITFQNPENGYTILKCAVKGYGDLVTVVGNLIDVNIGSVLLIEGDWKTDKKYGRQFLAQKWEETLPATVYGIEKYLGSGLIKGVGPKFAKRIVQLFGASTLEIIESEPQRLIEVDGIGSRRVAKIISSWERQKEIKNIMLFLQDHDVGTAFAAKIYTAYGDKAIVTIKENPYKLADDIWGIGFKTADQIATKLGFVKDSFVRCRSGILYTLSQLADSGDVYSERGKLTETAVKLLDIDEPIITMTLDHMIRTEDVKVEHGENDAVYLPPFYYAEVGVANRLRKLNNVPVPVLLANIPLIEKQTGMQYDNGQADAIRSACSSKVMVMTGGPGTGKTTTTMGIIRAYQTAGLQVVLAAPTGRAAKRMTEATGLEAKTIHRLLEFRPPQGYERNENNPLDGDVLVVDEASMIDLVLMNSLLKAIPDGMRLILVGDIDQLPSVGAGNVLRDIIDSGAFPVVQLTKIFRQAQNSRIIMNAHAINAGSFPDVSNKKGTDFYWIDDGDPEHTAGQIVELVKTRLPKFCGTNNIQVLTPMQRGGVGAATLNQMLQLALNPNSDGLYHGGTCYRLADKVMQIRNNYDREVFNGDVGQVCAVNVEDRELTVDFDGRKVNYDVTELDELTLAYATTIHKAQGSEYPVVVMPVLMTHYVMLQRNLIYTGITRAKKLIVLIGSKKALRYAIGNKMVDMRNSMLKRRLQG